MHWPDAHRQPRRPPLLPQRARLPAAPAPLTCRHLSPPAPLTCPSHLSPPVATCPSHLSPPAPLLWRCASPGRAAASRPPPLECTASAAASLHVREARAMRAVGAVGTGLQQRGQGPGADAAGHLTVSGVCTCVHACVCMCVHVCMCVIRVRACMHACMCVLVHARMHLHLHSHALNPGL